MNSDKKIFRLVHRQARAGAQLAVQNAPDGFIVTIQPETRTLEQNAKMWPMLTDVSTQVEWYGQRLTKEEWKDVFTAALKKQKVVPGLDGGFVVCGQSTRIMPKALFSELIELMYAFGAERGVEWSEPALRGYRELGIAA